MSGYDNIPDETLFSELFKDKEIMIQQEYQQKLHECWEEFLQKHEISTADGVTVDAFDQIFDRAYALGKQEKDADTVIQGWVARDDDGQLLYLYDSMPTRGINMWNDHGSLLTHLNDNLFPDLTWESEPIEVEIIIKRKKK